MRRLNGNGAGTMRSRTVIALAAATLLGAACQSLDVTNPNSPTEQSVLTDANGVLALGVGIQQQYAQGFINYLVPNALVSLNATSSGFGFNLLSSIQRLKLGGY